ncbi:Epoxide hydrolase 4 [Frankliniella occidentalis]|uniref:Epoxide hydrolase 3 n=1 Tax=Frankliniella occidentalis TaxID=133901 RepID=A0A6J1RTK7_FRAOC|nr:epoxide hydrolase 3 [Frankliniella occidentalis]KAE8741193.1 Epoxide hydrolase 4 [Frankliniella occidentalis]
MAQSLPLMVLTALYIYGKALLYACMVVPHLLLAQLRKPTKCLFWPRRRTTPPKCLDQVGQHGYVTVKGLKFHYVEKGDRSRPLMLFVHGFPEFWYSWRFQMNEFSKDYWTVAIDMRGYGDSAKPSNVSDYKLENMVDDIKEIVKALNKEKFILVAHDWGAVISWIFVDQHPEMVDKYIMMNGPHPKVHAIMMNRKEQASKSWYVFFFQLPFLPELWASWNDFGMFQRIFFTPGKNNPLMTEEDIEAFKYTFSQKGALTPPINYYRAALRRRISEGFGPKPKNPSQKVKERPQGLYIFGAKDIAIDIDGVAKHKSFFEPLQTVIIDDGNHFIQQDEPKAVNDAMRSFLKQST